MDFFTFIDSAAALVPFFREWALTGFDWEGSPQELFKRLRFRGKIAENAMLRATGAVNTHKGLIFSMGLFSAAYGRLFREKSRPSAAELFGLAALMARGTEDDFSAPDTERGASHGEAVYAQSGLKGVRAEAAQGFPGVRDLALPLLESLLNEGLPLNDAGAAVLLHLLAYTEDTNIAYRSGVSTLQTIQKEIRAFLDTKPDTETLLKKAAELDREFTKKNISPGGSADLLGISLFLRALGVCCASRIK
jgi:holo-ACP synthase/triphosphoribosyl-dephospho-CoA synthase